MLLYLSDNNIIRTDSVVLVNIPLFRFAIIIGKCSLTVPEGFSTHNKRVFYYTCSIEAQPKSTTYINIFGSYTVEVMTGFQK